MNPGWERARPPVTIIRVTGIPSNESIGAAFKFLQFLTATATARVTSSGFTDSQAASRR